MEEEKINKNDILELDKFNKIFSSYIDKLSVLDFELDENGLDIEQAIQDIDSLEVEDE